MKAPCAGTRAKAHPEGAHHGKHTEYDEPDRDRREQNLPEGLARELDQRRIQSVSPVWIRMKRGADEQPAPHLFATAKSRE